MRFIVLCLSLFSMLGCSVSIDGNNYQNMNPKFTLFEFFDGDVKAWGIVQNRSGDLVQRFEVDIEGTVDGNQLILDESFVYGVGEGVEKRVWTIKQTGAGIYQGGAGDIKGNASGRAYGNAMYWAYEMDLPVGEKTYSVQFEDWMWAFDENTIVNRSYIKKFGLVVAEVTIFMQKQVSQ